MKVEGSNITINDSVVNRLTIIPEGACEQDSYSGKNLFDISKVQARDDIVTLVTNGFTLTKTSNGRFAYWTAFDKVLPAGTYKFVGNETRNDITGTIGFQFYYQNESGTKALVLGSTITNHTFTFSNDVRTNGIQFYFDANATEGASTTLTDLMLVISTETDLSYEPYVGGIPSPNPDYPQDIRVVTGDNELVVQNKNIFNDDFLNEHYTKDENGYYTDAILTFNNYFNNNLPNIKFKENTQYTFQWYGYNDSGGNCRIQYFYTDGTSEGGGNLTTKPELHTFTSAINKTIDHINFTYGSSGSRTIHVKNIQLEVGTQATDYIAHQEQSTTLHLGTEYLAGIGDYKDEIVGKTDDWKIKRYVGKIVFDGSIDENWSNVAVLGNYHRTSINITGIKNITNNDDYQALSNNFIKDISVISGINPFPGAMCQFRNTSNVYFAISQTNLADFRTWLGSNNVTLYYVLETPVEIPITDTTFITDLNNMYQAMCYDGTTNITITSDSNNAQMEVEVTYTSESDMCEKLLFIFNKMKDKLYHIIRSL